MGVSYTGGLEQIRDIGLIWWRAARKSLHICPVLQFWRGSSTMEPWEPGNGSVTGQALHARGEGEEA